MMMPANRLPKTGWRARPSTRPVTAPPSRASSAPRREMDIANSNTASMPMTFTTLPTAYAFSFTLSLRYTIIAFPTMFMAMIPATTIIRDFTRLSCSASRTTPKRGRNSLAK